jgi:undecaprenyl-diphosphatase
LGALPPAGRPAYPVGVNWMTLKGYIRRFGLSELIVLLAILVLVGGTWGFIGLADAVREQETQEIDERILVALRQPGRPEVPIGPPWMGEVGRDITALGGVTFLAFLTFAVVGFLAMRRQFGAMWLILIAVVGGQVISTLLKAFFDRPRPDVVPHLSDVITASFPSGHSMMAAVVYLTLGGLLARLVDRWRLKLYFLFIAIFLTALVGISRVYMGVHYPTDVLAGWTVGAVWAVLCWLAARYLQYRGAVEHEGETAEMRRPEAGA